eukprot:1827750-Alexandrium_andersonii.AAC.1
MDLDAALPDEALTESLLQAFSLGQDKVSLEGLASFRQGLKARLPRRVRAGPYPAVAAKSDPPSGAAGGAAAAPVQQSG